MYFCRSDSLLPDSKKASRTREVQDAFVFHRFTHAACRAARASAPAVFRRSAIPVRRAQRRAPQRQARRLESGRRDTTVKKRSAPRAGCCIAKTAVRLCQACRTDNGRERVARGERIVRGIGDQQLHAAVQPAGARAGDEIFQAGITHQHTGDKPHKQENALPAVFFVHRRMSAAKIQIAPPLQAA